MHIEQLDNNKIKAVVNADDQREYGVCYETMNYSDDATRRLCEKILSVAKRENGFRTENSKLLVEARQSLNGCVTLYISRLDAADEENEYLCQTVLFRDTDALLDGCRIFSDCKRELTKNVLYEYNGVFYLYFELYASLLSAKRLLSNLLEYSERSAFSNAWLGEHGKMISDNAIGSILKIQQ